MASPAVAGLSSAIAILVTAAPSIPSLVPDSDAYIAIAEGRHQQVPRPFANRVLHPFLVKGFAAETGIDLHSAFVLTAVVAVVVLCVAVALTLARGHGSAVWILPMFTPFAVSLFRDYYLPDLFHASLLALFAATFESGVVVPAILLFALHLTRESTVLLSAFAVGVKVLGREWRHAVSLAAAASIGLVWQVNLGWQGSPNVHEMNEALYLAAKVPFNAFKNLLGIVVWTNTTVSACEPVWQFAASPLRVGRIDRVGLCAWSPDGPLFTASTWLTIFGVAPALCLAILRRGGGTLVRRLSPTELLLIGYGGTAFLLGPALGASVDRLTGYGWPAFWIGVPLVATRVIGTWSFKLPVLHLTAAWAPIVLGLLLPRGAALGGAAVIGLSASAIAVAVMRKALRDTA